MTGYALERSVFAGQQIGQGSNQTKLNDTLKGLRLDGRILQQTCNVHGFYLCFNGQVRGFHEATEENSFGPRSCFPLGRPRRRTFVLITLSRLNSFPHSGDRDGGRLPM